MKKYSGKTGADAGSKQGEQGFWPSYADMMSAVALILFFLMLMSYIQNLITGNDLRSTQETLDDTRSALVLTQAQVEEAEDELSLITADLDGARLELAAQNDSIARQQAEIDAQRQSIGEQKALIDEQTALIDQQTATIATQQIRADQQEKYLASTQAEITELRGQMQTIAVLRLSILEQMKESIEKVMGSAGKVSIGDNGSIILSESVLFDYGSSAVKDDSTQMLDQLSKVFSAFLADNENAKYVDSIVISGHTDNRGGDVANRTLSTERANSVLTYIMNANSGALKKYEKYFCAAGYGPTRPVADNGTDAGRAANRRIEISIILKDETVMEIVEQYLAIEVPKSN